ncbi:hypothetical protein GLW07_09475 [Bacillus hwajinpoensis]|uniref:Uncharacterized protein n=1 Tax=Guptibacillus hwajinpoensis TaxID=208199 RepID=A0A845EYD8_9BACL|nr:MULTISPECIES: hypothetical protein [Bacillaceae]MYL63581.1 hypothetical protein [Pseudalkalibacillus hwajinpoensis]PFG12763.1 hypothetical protein ATG70_0950 [Bacillus sp. es.036]
MVTLTTGPIENKPTNGIRTTQQVTIKISNRSSVNTSTVEIVGKNLNGTQTVYVLELITIPVNGVVSKTYFADLDGYQFSFNITGLAMTQTGISVWGKANGTLQPAHRLVLSELKGD